MIMALYKYCILLLLIIKWVTIYVVQIIDTNLGRMCLLLDLHFTLLYVVVSISTYT